MSKTIVTLGFVCLLLQPKGAFVQTGKAVALGKVTAQKSCGNGLTQDSYCGTCVRAGKDGVSLTTYATCTKACAKLPKGITNKQVELFVNAADAGKGKAATPCGSKNTPGPCDIGYARSEKFEYFPENDNVCAVVKNWSSDRDTLFIITAVRK